MEPDAPRAAKPYQFSLRALMILTAAVAGVAAASAWLGPGAAIPAVLAIVLAANWRGVLRFAQSGRTQLRLAWLASALFAVSLASPCLRGCNNEPIHGWRLALASATIPAEELIKVVNEEDHRAEVSQAPGKWVIGQLYFAAICLGNLLLLSAVGIPWLLRRRWPSLWLPALVAVAATAMAMFMLGEGKGTARPFEGLLFGVWLWLGAGFLLVVLIPMNRRALIAALLAAAVFTLNRL